MEAMIELVQWVDANPPSTFGYLTTKKEYSKHYAALLSLTSTDSNREMLIQTNAVEVISRILMNAPMIPGYIPVSRSDDVLVAALGNMMYNEAAKKQLMDTFNGATLFVHLMKSTNPEIIAHGSRAIMSVTTIYEYKLLLAQAGIIPLLVNSISSEFDSMNVLQKTAMGSLANIAIHQDNKKLFGENRVLTSVLSLAKRSDDDHVLHQAARCLLSISASSENRPKMIVFGVIDVLNILFKRTTCPDVINNAIGTLGNLAISEEAARDITIIFPIITLICNEAFITRHLMRVVNFFSSNEIIKEQLRTDDMIKEMIAVFDKKYNIDDASSIYKDVAGILANIVIGNSALKLHIVWELNGLEPLVKLLNEDNTNTELMSSVIRAIFALLYSNEAKERFIKLNGFDALIKYAASDIDELSKYAMGALANLATYYHDKDDDMTQLATQRFVAGSVDETSRQAGRLLNDVLMKRDAYNVDDDIVIVDPIIEVIVGIDM